jgi:hypothetical protein
MEFPVKVPSADDEDEKNSAFLDCVKGSKVKKVLF